MNELPESARGLIALANEAEAPPPGARERVRERVLIAVAAGAASGVASAASAAGGTAKASTAAGAMGFFAGTSKVIVAAGALAVIGTAGVLLRASQQPAHQPQPSAAAASVKTAAPVTAPRASSKAEIMPPSTAVSVAPEPRVETEQPPSAASAAPARSAPHHTSGGSETRGGDLRAETNLLSAASGALDRRDLRVARALLAQHRAQFQDGQLRQERAGLEVLLGCVAGEHGALAQAQRYLQRERASVLAPRVEAACQAKAKP